MVNVRYNPFATERYELHTQLTPDECVRRLKENMDTTWSLRHVLLGEPVHEGPVRGWVSRRGFTLYIMLRRRRERVSGTVPPLHQTVASGRLISMADGTRIVITLGMSRFEAIFVTLWVTLVGLGTLASIFSPTGLFGLIVCLGLLASGVSSYIYSCQVASGARGGEDEHQFLLEFLRRTLSSEQIVGREG